MDRRELFRRLATVAGSLPAFVAFARSSAGQVTIPSEFDTSLESIAVAFRSTGGMTLGYMSQPRAKGPHPGVILLHDVAGVTTGMRGAARNLATSGYVVVAPDFVSPQGGTAGFRGVQADVERAVRETSPSVVSTQATGALAYLKSHGAAAKPGAGLIGFGWGATQALGFAAGRSEIAAVVAFYPDPQQSMKVFAKLTAPVLAIFAADDAATSAGVQQFEQMVKTSRRAHTVRIFPGVTRGFHDPGETKIYKPDVAKEAWTLAVQHLDTHTKEGKGGPG